MEARSHLRQLHIVSRPQLEERRVRGEAIRRRVARLQVSALNLLEGYAKEMHMRYRGDAREMEASSHLEGNHRASNHLLAEARPRLDLVPATWQGGESEELRNGICAEGCGTGCCGSVQGHRGADDARLRVDEPLGQPLLTMERHTAREVLGTGLPGVRVDRRVVPLEVFANAHLHTTRKTS